MIGLILTNSGQPGSVGLLNPSLSRQRSVELLANHPETNRTTVRIRSSCPDQNTLDMWVFTLIRLQRLLHTLSSTLLRLGRYT